MYQNAERYFKACENCGACCSVPGIFLPHEIALLANHLKLDPADLFRGYLIAELFTPDVEAVPAFLIAPVKRTQGSVRDEKLLFDAPYRLLRGASCIFRNSATRSCDIHAHKPFGCTLLICGKMTKARPLMLNKTYYYHQWLDSQGILFAIFPGLAPVYRRLLDAVSSLPAPGKSRNAALTKGNVIIGNQISEIMNGRNSNEQPFYRHLPGR